MTRSRITPLLAVVLAVAIAALAAIFIVKDSHAIAVKNSRTAILGVAEQDAVDFTTYDYMTLGNDFDRFLDQTRDPLHSQYATDAPELKMEFRSLQVKSVGTIVDSGVVDQTATTARVLVAVNDQITNKKVPKGQIVYDRLAFDMVKVAGHWYATEVQEL